MTEKTQAKNHQIQVIFKCKSILKPKIEKEIPDLKQKKRAEINKLHSIKTRFDNDANSITEDEFKECLDNIYNYNVLYQCYFFINNELPNPVSIFMTDILKHKYYEAEQESYENHLDYLNSQKAELIITNLVCLYNDHFKKAHNKDQKFIEDKIIHSNTSVLDQTFKSIEHRRNISIQEIHTVDTKLSSLYNIVNQNTMTNISAEIDEICHLRYTLNELFLSFIDNVKKNNRN